MIILREWGFIESRHLLLLSIDSRMKSMELVGGIAKAFLIIPKMSPREPKRSQEKAIYSLSLVRDHVHGDYYNISILN